MISAPLLAAYPGLRGQWLVAARRADLKRAPLARKILGLPLALYVDETGTVVAALDRCPHRGAPLSSGRMVGATLQCPYHGWRFGRDGRCSHAPGAESAASINDADLETIECTDAQGLVWVRFGGGKSQPFVFPYIDDPRYTTIQLQARLPAGPIPCAEGILDVVHTMFVHRGLFRSKERRKAIEARRTVAADELRIDYIGEERPAGLLGRALAPGGGVVEHCDRFQRPAVAQVEYRLGEVNHIFSSQFLTPEDEDNTIVTIYVSLRSRLPLRPFRPLIQAVARAVLRQDALILRLQTLNLERFPEKRFVHGPADLALGPVAAMLKGQKIRAGQEVRRLVL